jgi:hypothetical protein
MGEANERTRMREEVEARQRAQQDEYINKLVTKTKEDYEKVKELLPENNPKAWKALVSLRAQARKARAGWRDLALATHKQDPETKKSVLLTHQEKDVLIGQYNSVLLVFEILEQIREIHKQMVPGKEADYIRQRVFGRNSNG